MNPLAAALTDTMSATSGQLAVLSDGEWTRHPWPEVLEMAQNVADWLGNEDATALGLVGEPTVEFVAASFTVT